MKQNKLLKMVLKIHRNQPTSLTKKSNQKIVSLALHIQPILMTLPLKIATLDKDGLSGPMKT